LKTPVRHFAFFVIYLDTQLQGHGHGHGHGHAGMILDTQLHGHGHGHAGMIYLDTQLQGHGHGHRDRRSLYLNAHSKTVTVTEFLFECS
jgi:hypothetical protein